jgi:hypothetical protein
MANEPNPNQSPEASADNSSQKESSNELNPNQSPEASADPPTSENNSEPDNSQEESNSGKVNPTFSQDENKFNPGEKEIGFDPFFKKPSSKKSSDKSQQTEPEKINIDPEESQANPWATMTTDLLEEKLKEIEKDITIQREQAEILTEDIIHIVETIRFLIDELQISRLRSRKNARENERELCRQKREDLELDKKNISKILEERKDKAKRSSQDETKTHEQGLILAQSLFKDGQPIENTVLYVATFFPELNISDFKDVVSKFLEKSPPIKIIQEEGVIKNGEKETVQKEVEKNAVEVWKESFQKPEQFLKKCYLKPRRKDSNFIIDFSLSYLRENLKQYFQEEEIFYLEEQLIAVQNLLFFKSDKVAEQAISIIAEGFIYSPNIYNFEWLLNITLAAEANQSDILFDRVSKLLYEIQIRLEPSQSKPIVKRFLDSLLANNPDYVFHIIRYLMYRHLCSTLRINRLDSLQQLLGWVRKRLNQDMGDAYGVLLNLLKQQNTGSYIYDLLRIIKTWLPEPELSVDKYSPSNQAALLLLIQYCAESLWRIEPKDYGSYPSKYPLFSSLKDGSDFDSKLEIIVSLLFHRSGDKTLAIKLINFKFFLEDENETIEPLEMIAFLIEKWFIILCGLDIEQCKPEAEKIANSLLRQVIEVTDASERRNLNRYWAEWAASLLKEAANKSASTSSRQEKEILMKERSMVQELRSRFQSLQEQQI